MTDAFAGAKVLLFVGARLLVLRRDHAPGLVWPGMLDFPGGGREGLEDPKTCAIRETCEEVGLVLEPGDLRIAHLRDVNGRRSWFFAAHLPDRSKAEVVFGGEGQGCQFLPPQAFVAAPDAVPHFRTILSSYLSERRDEYTAR